METTKANKKLRGINLVIIPEIFKNEYRKQDLRECPLSTIKSKKLTDLTVQATMLKAKRMVINDFKISIEKYL